MVERRRGVLIGILGTGVVGVGVLSLVGCPRSRDSGNTVEPAPQSVTPFASNANDVTRYQDEVPQGPDATVARDNTAVRKAPGTGDVVATLSSGAEVIKISTHGRDDLVTFDDPKGGSSRLMGWVADSALEESAPPTPNSPVPPLLGEGGVVSDDGGTPNNPPDPPDPKNPGKHHHHPHPRPHQ
jgi:hypothetical protein